MGEKIKLCAYDFDGCLFASPLPDSGKEIWKKVTGNDYPHVGWWGRIESLDDNIFDIKPYKPVMDSLNRDYSDKDNLTIILTSRLPKIQPAIENLLNKFNIKVDEISTKDKGKGKDVRIKEYITNNPNITEIDVYDDREKEILVFLKLKRDLKFSHPHINLNIFRVNEGNILNLDVNN